MSSPIGSQADRFLDYLVAERGLSPNTTAAYRRDLRRYVGFLADRGIEDVADVSETDVAEHVAGLSSATTPSGRAYRASSVARALASVRSFHRFMVREGVLAIDAAAAVARPRVPRNLPRPLSVAEIERVLASPAGSGSVALRDRAVMELLYGAGLRISELVGLDVDDVDLESGSVRVLGKGSKERVVPLGRFADKAVSAYLTRARPSLASKVSRSALFLNARNGGRLTRQGCAGLLSAHVERAGIRKRVTPHTFRHSFATHLLEGGADVRVVQELLGHASVATTQIYTLVTKEHLREVYFEAHPRARRTTATKGR